MHTVQYLICKGPRWLFLSPDFLAVGGPGSKVNITVDGRTLEQVESYVYLGQLITEDGRCDKEIRS